MSQLRERQIQLVRQQRVHPGAVNEYQRRQQNEQVFRVDLWRVGGQMRAAQCLNHCQYQQRNQQKHSQSSQRLVHKRHQQSNQEKPRDPASSEFRQFILKQVRCVDHQLAKVVVQHHLAEVRLQRPLELVARKLRRILHHGISRGAKQCSRPIVVTRRPGRQYRHKRQQRDQAQHHTAPGKVEAEERQHRHDQPAERIPRQRAQPH